MEITQWPILIALFSQCVPPSRVCYCRTGGYAGQGGDAEPAESEHFLSNNLKSCGVGRGHRGGKVQGAWMLAGGAHRRWVWGGGQCKVPDHQVCSGYVKGEHCFWNYLGKRVKYAVWSARAGWWLVFGLTCAHCNRMLEVLTTQNSKAILLWLHPPLSMWLLTHTWYMQRNYCFSDLVWRPPTHLPREMFYQCCMWGVSPMAFTHIPLMPAGDVASGVETSRGLGTVNRRKLHWCSLFTLRALLVEICGWVSYL